LLQKARTENPRVRGSKSKVLGCDPFEVSNVLVAPDEQARLAGKASMRRNSLDAVRRR
jgi:hypothetical protein